MGLTPTPPTTQTPQSSWPWKSTALSLVRSSTSIQSREVLGQQSCQAFYNPGACAGDQVGLVRCSLGTSSPGPESSAEFCPQTMGWDELEGIGNKTAQPIQPNRALCPEDPGPPRGCQSGMQEVKQGYKALSISLTHSGHPRQSGSSTAGWGPWCAESRALWVPGSQCGESKELMKMSGNTLLCIRLRSLAENQASEASLAGKLGDASCIGVSISVSPAGHLDLLLCFGKKI